MATKRERGVMIRTPKGIAGWVQIDSPDDKYNKYSVKLRLPADNPETQALKGRLEKMRDDFYDAEYQRLVDEKKVAVAKKLTKREVLEVELDKETGDETGYLVLAANLKAGGIIKNGPRAGQPWSQKPDVFDAKGNRLTNPPKVFSGSELKLSIEVRAYAKADDKSVGVSKDLRAVQIIKLITGGARGFGDYGFDEEDGDEIEDRPVENRSVALSGGFDDDDPANADL